MVDLESTELPTTLEEWQDVLRQLVEEGALIAVSEIDLETGKLRNRYFHPRHVPKSH